MKFLKRLTPEWAIRITLGVMYLYSGVDILRHPTAWTWAIRSLPTFLNELITKFGVDKFLYIQGTVEIILAVIFLVWLTPRFVVKYVSLISAVEMIAIVLLVGIDSVTFRDIGLIGSGLALFLILKK